MGRDKNFNNCIPMVNLVLYYVLYFFLLIELCNFSSSCFGTKIATVNEKNITTQRYKIIKLKKVTSPSIKKIL